MCKKIITVLTCASLIFGGSILPTEAKEIEKLIDDSGLVVIPNSSHYAYLENLNYVVNILKNFL